MSEQERDGQPTWWPFSVPLALPIPLRKNSAQAGQGSSITSPFSSLFSQSQWIPSGKSVDKGDAEVDAEGSAGAGITGGSEDAADGRPKGTKDRPRVQWLFDRAQMRRQGLMTEDEMKAPPRDEQNSSPVEDENTQLGHEDEGGRNEDGAGPQKRRMHIPLPKRHKGPFTLANSKTPGWDQPWSPSAPPQARTRAQRGSKEGANGIDYGQNDYEDVDSDDGDPAGKVNRRGIGRSKLTLRRWILHNNSVPLANLFYLPI